MTNCCCARACQCTYLLGVRCRYILRIADMAIRGGSTAALSAIADCAHYCAVHLLVCIAWVVCASLLKRNLQGSAQTGKLRHRCVQWKLLVCAKQPLRSVQSTELKLSFGNRYMQLLINMLQPGKCCWMFIAHSLGCLPMIFMVGQIPTSRSGLMTSS